MAWKSDQPLGKLRLAGRAADNIKRAYQALVFDWGKDPAEIGALPFDKLIMLADQLRDWIEYKRRLKEDQTNRGLG